MSAIDKDLFASLAEAIRRGEEDETESLTRRALADGVEPLAIVQEVLVPTLTEVGEAFQDFEIYLPQLMMAGEAAERATTLVEEATLAAGRATTAVGTVVIGTVEGDVHDIGKNIVVAMLSAHGFRVVDLGREVAASAFLEAAEREKADIVCLSALMTTTLPAQRRTVLLFGEVGVRERFRMLVGGGAVSQAWSDEIGADGYAADAAAAVDLCKAMIGDRA
jgi:corrinoid protein of di/trimethylamine methyltransferase